MRKLNILMGVLITMPAFSQQGNIGVNTAEPKTTLDISGKRDSAGNLLSSDMTGLQAPRLTRAELTAKTVIYGREQKGALIYITDVSAGDTIAARKNITDVGYYYFDGSVWQKIATGSDINIYNSDGTLTGERIVTQNSQTLDFQSTQSTDSFVKFTKGTPFSDLLHLPFIGIRRTLNTNPRFNTSITSNLPIGGVMFQAANGRAYNNNAYIGAVTAENQSDIAKGANLIFSTAQNGNNSIRERMRILHNGNVGIGTTDPHAPLQFNNGIVNRKIVLYETNDNDNQFFGFGINPGILRYQVDVTNTDHVFYAGVNANSSNELMRIKGNGRVGIGTSNPTSSLHVNGSFRLTDGTQQQSRVLTSDANGVGSWQSLSAGNKTAVIYQQGIQTFSTSSRTTFNTSLPNSSTIILSNDIGASVTSTNISLTAGKYLITISSDIAGNEYGIFDVYLGSNNALLFKSFYGSWFNGSFLLDITGGNNSIYFAFSGELSNPNIAFYRNDYTNAGWTRTVTILKLN